MERQVPRCGARLLEGLIGELASRLTGSSDLYDRDSRRPYASINFVTCHDGFSLQDLVSYNDKHNLANGEDNRDGDSHNRSWNCGVEGPSDKPEIIALRARQKRNLIATLCLSQGVPMLRAGDELSQSQNGNNNPYCQDNETSWLDWRLDTEEREFFEFVRRMLAVRREHPIFRRRKFFEGRPIHGQDIKDLAWLNPDGGEMSEEEWNLHHARCLGVYLSGAELDEVDERGNPMRDDDFLVLINAHHEAIAFMLPAHGRKEAWRCLMDTACNGGLGGDGCHATGSEYTLQGRSLALFTRPRLRAAADAMVSPGEARATTLRDRVMARFTSRGR